MFARLIFPFLAFLLIGVSPVLADQDDPEQKHYWKVVRPIFHGKCGSCHNAVDSKGGVNIVRFDFIVHIVRNGKLFNKVIREIESGNMPPNTEPPLADAEKDTLLFYLKKYLSDALAEPDPGIIPPRRLSNTEYRYTIEDLLGVSVNADSLLPSDGSGGSGFDNQARTLYMSPLRLERYYELAAVALDKMNEDQALWRKWVPEIEMNVGQKIKFWFQALLGTDKAEDEFIIHEARKRILAFATRAYRRILTADERERLIQLFEEVYLEQKAADDAFDLSIREVFHAVLISPHFLYRQEADLPQETPYPVNEFELASRLSYFLWSSLPDETLMDLAYQGKLNNKEELGRQVSRMMADPKARRLANNFAKQWLRVNKMDDPAFQMDPEKYPAFNSLLKDVMQKEVEAYFQYVFTQSRNILDLIDSDYTFLNEDLSKHYDIKEGPSGKELELHCLPDNRRGGVLGMAAVLTATSLPGRTSPVLRGKWVMEQILGTPPPPPPPDVPELEAAANHGDELSLRKLLEMHRADPACSGCHKDMDALGLGLENFDAIGRWRDQYQGNIEIDTRGALKTGEVFETPVELREILLNQKEKFARNFSEKMLSFALGRSLIFADTPTIDHLTEHLIDHHFDSISFLTELVNSFPFRNKKTDPVKS